MAPPRIQSEPVPHQSQDYSAFIAKLTAYHEKRGTHFDPEPRVGAKTVDLLLLYTMVTERGGYDKISDEKLAWRKLGSDFHLGTNNLPALAFQLKTVYYKYLAAYEISTVYGKEPPPKEILEDTTARGGGLLSRSVDNFKPRERRETFGNETSEASGDDGTPARERNDSEEVPGSGGRATRGLRQAPPQRILFQPDTQPSGRQGRHHQQPNTSHPPPTQHQSHQPQGPRGASTSYNPSSNTENMSLAVTNYEPRPQMPLTLRPVITPGNNAVEFARRQKAVSQVIAMGKVPVATPKVMLPGTGFDGPNIYVRCLCALKSGIPSEQDYALHHLVKISMERGDKYRFESFPGLAEALIEKVLEISSLFYKIEWQTSYTDDGLLTSGNILDGLEGTPDILQKISSLSKLPVDDNIHTEEFSDALLQINEAALTLRNMVMLEENASYVSELYPLRDFLSIALNLPSLDSVVELKHYALDIAEQLTKYISSTKSDPLYLSLLAQLESQDRGAILTSLRAISRISMNLEENNLLNGVPATAVQNIIDWTLLNDEDLVHACLDFLYQYTAVVDNVDFLLSNEIQVEPLINQLTRLLMHNVKTVEREWTQGHNRGYEDNRIPAPSELAPVPRELLDLLVKMDEPERSTQWLRSLFEEDKDEYITQIALWQAYQSRFTIPSNEVGRPLLAAADFIKNVSTTFADRATAQVQAGAVQKFVIKGIRYRSVPVDLKGEEYTKCLWSDPRGKSPCGEFFMSPEQKYQHILKDHCGARQLPDGKFENTHGLHLSCHWDKCHRFTDNPATTMSQFATHIKVHLPPPRHSASKDAPDYFGPPPAKKTKPSYVVTAPKKLFSYHVTAMDETGQPAGIPLSAILVLRNLARNIPKTEVEETTLKEGGLSWVERLFKPVEPRLFEVMAHNRTMQNYITDLIGSMRYS